MAKIKIPIQLGDPNYFCNKSWTLSYNFVTNSFVSFHTYLPNWYIAENNFFYSGLNDCCSSLVDGENKNNFDFIVGVPVDDTDCYIGECTAIVIDDSDSTNYDCTLSSDNVIVVDGPYCEIEGFVEGGYECDLDGGAIEEYENIDDGESLCDVPEGLTNFYLIAGYTNNSGTTDSSETLNDACDAVTYYKTFGDEYINIVFNAYRIQAFQTEEGERTYWLDSLTCECIPDGWYFTEESALSNSIFHVEDCIITEIIDTCGQTTTTTTTSPAQAPECYFEAIFTAFSDSNDCEYNGGEVTITSCEDGYSYNVSYYTCDDCSASGSGIICNTYSLTIGKWYYDSISGMIIHVNGFIECGCEESEYYILDETKKNSCDEVECESTSTTTTSTTTTVEETTSTTTTTTTTILPETIYGYVYNWWAAIGDTDGDDVGDKNISSNDNWQLPNDVDWRTLATTVEPGWTYVTNTVGAKLKSTGYDYWLDSGDPTDEGLDTNGFSARGTGQRNVSGSFIEQKATLYLWRPSESTTEGSAMVAQFSYSESRLVIPSNPTTGRLINKRAGASIRLVNNSTALNDGETGTYIGNNGKAYPTICIGAQEWMQVNLEETEWRSGELIPQIGWDAQGSIDWSNATSAAMSIP